MGRVKLHVVTKTYKRVLRDGEGGSATLVYGGRKTSQPSGTQNDRGSVIAETIGVVYFALTQCQYCVYLWTKLRQILRPGIAICQKFTALSIICV